MVFSPGEGKHNGGLDLFYRLETAKGPNPLDPSWKDLANCVCRPHHGLGSRKGPAPFWAISSSTGFLSRPGQREET